MTTSDVLASFVFSTLFAIASSPPNGLIRPRASSVERMAVIGRGVESGRDRPGSEPPTS